MKLFDYLDNEYKRANNSLQDDGYSPSMKSKTNAIHSILELQKSLLKSKWFVALLFSFVKCVVLNKWPEQVDLKKYMADKAAKQKLKTLDNSKETGCQNVNQVVS